MESFIQVKPKNVQRPKTLVCFICGREYGTRSLEIHIKTCEKKWDIEQQKLPASKRKPCPQPPNGFQNMIRMAQGLKPIGPDGKVISQDQFYGQQISGNGKYLDPAVAINQYNEQAFQNWDQNVLEPCPHCNRTFKPESLKFHLKACRADRPLKKPIVRSIGENGEKIVHYADHDQEKIPHLGMAARQQALNNQQKILEGKKSSQPKQSQIKTGGISSFIEEQKRIQQNILKRPNAQQNLDELYQQMVSKDILNKPSNIPKSNRSRQDQRSFSADSNQQQPNDQNKKKSKWREEREKFIQAIRIGKQINQLENNPDVNKNVEIQQKIAQLAKQIPSQNVEANMKQCPHCQRRFNLQAAERHIPICQNIQHKAKPPPSQRQLEEGRQLRKSAYGGSPLRKFDAPKTQGGPFHFKSIEQQEQQNIYDIIRNTQTDDFQKLKSNLLRRGSNERMYQARTEDQSDHYKNQNRLQQISQRGISQIQNSTQYQKNFEEIDVDQSNQFTDNQYQKSVYTNPYRKVQNQQQNQKINEKNWQDENQQMENQQIRQANLLLKSPEIKKSKQLFQPQDIMNSMNQSFCIGEIQQKFPSLMERSAQFSSVQCPHCSRKFNEKAALRHIPVCSQKNTVTQNKSPCKNRQQNLESKLKKPSDLRKSQYNQMQSLTQEDQFEEQKQSQSLLSVVGSNFIKKPLSKQVSYNTKSITTRKDHNFNQNELFGTDIEQEVPVTQGKKIVELTFGQQQKPFQPNMSLYNQISKDQINNQINALKTRQQDSSFSFGNNQMAAKDFKQTSRNNDTINNRDTVNSNAPQPMSLSKDGQLIINQQQKKMPKFCVSCGEKFLAENHKFCAECGTPRLLV